MGFFQTLLDYIQLFFNYIFGMIKSLLSGIALITASLAYNNVFVAFMPTFLGSCFVVVFGIFLVRFFMGK